MKALVLVAAFTSGFVIMSIEMLGGRIIAPWFGGDIYVWGSIITVFMLSLSLGYLIGGRLTLRKNAGLRPFAMIFFSAAVLILPLLFAADQIMGWIFERIIDPRYGSLVASMALFFLPSTVMGMVSPYSVRLLTQSKESSGASAGFLYFVSTLGSALGTLATSFYLVALFEINQIVLGAAFAMAAVAVVTLQLARRWRVA
ncbi:fused MFS/spermidine synthase [Permianibacter aggregans]|uniref:Glycosyl transferase n=1 Tax=Permianibacter aggregans TaxID=1510150 RepID=A0A4R6UQR0_9GAMM|nr:fused MFS/spermidine synthase [Permianibacter aggregans]QGX38476.1 glycosyl transferase [Permianibacter aggregans]TDQ45594.1 hypothetical protein EV696_11962 [Permianibacter aggregans]